MASESLFFILVLVVLLSTKAEGNNNNFNLAMASKSVSDKGYHAMSMIFDVFFKIHDVSKWLSGNSTLTVFCPPDSAFFSSKYPQPPLTLLQYHVVPLKLDIGALASLPHGSKIDTLLLGHPLVVTILQNDEYVSLNGVKVTEWNLYNEGGLIIHGVDNFFDPAFETLIYPWFDVKNDIHAEVVSGFSWVIRELKDNWSLLLALSLMVVIVLGLLGRYVYCRKDNKDEYERIQQQEEAVDHVLDVEAVYV
ncbi:hypothetical protein FEM48_Zijuj01G0230900 [Ziziphus jujuba var. spinosa]|uniref:FAS1 domain-containing protein n=1 Tax=Ziziphus jujuba var. spinosa TaxID=714518 RepID=A0A978W430_ZIZJJ|nr:hypothetical protein FEM48_Zijuj01G0230900 [Ziziphus jujuba var. spinosa]